MRCKIKLHFFRRHVRRKKYLDRDKCATAGSACSPDVILSKNKFFDSLILSGCLPEGLFRKGDVRRKVRLRVRVVRADAD